MLLHPSAGRSEVSAADLAAVTALYDRGQYVTAWARAEEIAPPRRWLGAEAQIMAGRIAMNLQAPRLSRGLHQRAWREHRDEPMAAYYRVLDLQHRRGPLAAWQFLERLPAWPEAPPERRSDLLTARASVLAMFRDFERAEAALDEAEALTGPTEAWLWTQRSSLRQAQDRYPEALAASARALEARPWYRPAVQQQAEVLQLLERDEEAECLLAEAMRHLESPAVAGQLAILQMELERPEECLATLRRLRELAPPMEPAAKSWWHGRLSDAWYATGNVAQAAEEAVAAREIPFFGWLAERLKAPGAEARPVRCAVPFVRQHHVTCAPATISALSRYQQDPIDHLELARVICYDGTPAHVERHWLEEHGWVVREFCVTWEILRALLDRGMPFTLATVETQSAHLQAVVGYDALRGTLLIRDPYLRTHTEAAGEEFLARYAATGPRGSVFLRPEQTHRLEGLELPEAVEYDHAYGVERALHEHDRARAAQHAQKLADLAPDGRLTWEARRTLAAYDGHLARQLEATEALLARYPDEGNLLLSQLWLLRATADRERTRARLRELAERPGAQPIFWREWAGELMGDGRRHVEARRLLDRALRVQPGNAESLTSLAHLLWGRQEQARAAELYRFCACLAEKREDYARSFLLAARHLRQTDSALAHFRRHFEAFGSRSAQPLRILFRSLTLLERPVEAFAALEEALRLRPEDGELQLFAADAFARYGQPERAASLLATAEARSPRTAWLRTAAALAGYRCDLQGALVLWQQILPEEPLAMDAQQAVTRLLAETESRAAAQAQLRAACTRFPHHVELHRLEIEWARGEGAAAVEPLVRDFLTLIPDDAWGHRELALTLAALRRFEEAHRELALADELEPGALAGHTVRAQVALSEHRLAEAREHARAALRLSVDHTGALNQLVSASDTFASKREAMAFIRAELIRQVVFGDGLLTYRELAYPILEPEELLAGLREAQAARPDLWHAWTALTLQLADLRRLDEALSTATRATELFPLHAPPWLELALVHAARGEIAEEVAPLHRALQLQPAWGRVSRVLASVQERLGDPAEAERVLEQAIAAAPLEASNHGALAELHWRLGRRPAAFQCLEHALRLEPGSSEIWNLLREWSPADHDADRASRLARTLTEGRPGEARSWYFLAQMLPAEALEERLAALVRATELSPHFIDAHDLRAQLLAAAGRLEEAAAACAPAAWAPEELPPALAGRAAWLESRRGHFQAAIARMRHLVTVTPDYYWGWNQLVEWHARTGQLEEAREAARRMARLVPNSAVPLGHLADLQARLGDAAESLATLRRALTVDPMYTFAAYEIFDRELEAGDLAGAAKSLAHLRRFLPGAEADAREIRLECRSKRAGETLGLFRRLCFVPSSEERALNIAAGALIEGGRGAGVELICRETMTQPGAHPATAHWWAERVTNRQAWKEQSHLAQLDPATPVGRKGWNTFLEGLAGKRQLPRLRKLLRRNGPALRADLTLWGTAGYALLHLGRHAEVIRWMRGWREREGLLPWMLSNLAAAYRHAGDSASLSEAIAVSRRALELTADHTTRGHQLWVAWADALLGNLPQAERLLREASSTQERAPFFDALAALTRAMIELEQAPLGARSRLFAAKRREFRREPSRSHLFAKPFRTPLRLSYTRMARVAGVMNNPFWRVAYLKSPWVAQPASGGFRRYWWVLAILLSNLLRLCSQEHPGVGNVRPPAYQNLPTPAPARPRYEPMPFPIEPPPPKDFHFLPTPEFPPVPGNENPG